jgi:hypothetical protein
MAFGVTPVDTSATPIPMSSAVPDGSTTPYAVAGGPSYSDTGNTKVAVQVYVKDGNDVTLGTSTDANTVASVIGRLTKIRDLLLAALTVGGSAASGASNAGSPVKIGGVFNTTQPTVTNGQAVDAQTTARGAQIVATGTDTFTVTVNGALTAHQSTNVDQLNGTTTDTNSGTKSAGTLRVVLATDQPALTNKLLVTPDSVALPSHQSTNVDQLNGTTADTNSGTKSAGTLRVVLATDQPALTNKLLVTPDSVALPANQSCNTAQINGVTPLMGNGVTGTGSARVTIASDNTAFSVNAVESGTWTVQPGNTPNTSAWLTQPVAGTTGGSTPFHAISAASTNGTNVKNAAGTLYGLCISNSNVAARFFKLYDKSTTPTVGTDTPKRTIQIPGSATVIEAFPLGLAFASGIGFGYSTGLADADTGATGTDASLDLDYH